MWFNSIKEFSLDSSYSLDEAAVRMLHLLYLHQLLTFDRSSPSKQQRAH